MNYLRQLLIMSEHTRNTAIRLLEARARKSEPRVRVMYEKPSEPLDNCVFFVKVFFGNKCAVGRGKNGKEAKRNAAREMLMMLGDPGADSTSKKEKDQNETSPGNERTL